MAKEGTIQLQAATGGDTAPGGAYVLTEIHGVTCTGICAAVSGLNEYNVQIAKMAWGTTGEYYWVDNAVSSAGTTGCGAAPLPCQLIDSNGNPVKYTTISGSSSTALDVVIRSQGGSASQLDISNISAGHDSVSGGYIAVAGTTTGHYVPVAGSTAGGAIPHVGATTDKGSSADGSIVGTYAKAIAGTGAHAGTISSKLRTVASDIHQIMSGGTGSNGVYRISGLSADIRSVVGWTGDAGGPSVLIKATGGFTASISAIAGGLTIGIGSVSVDNPVVIGHRVAGFTFEQVNSTSTTLVSGVRLKNINGSGTLTVTYDSTAGSTTGMTSGFQLDDREELFVEVDNLTKVYVMCGLTAGCTFSYYAT